MILILQAKGSQQIRGRARIWIQSCTAPNPLVHNYYIILPIGSKKKKKRAFSFSMTLLWPTPVPDYILIFYFLNSKPGQCSDCSIVSEKKNHRIGHHIWFTCCCPSSFQSFFLSHAPCILSTAPQHFTLSHSPASSDLQSLLSLIVHS
jgi:hypothetical protein